MNLLSIGLVRGLIGQTLGTVAGMLIVTAIRLVMGVRPIWKAEPAWFLGGVIGIIGFLYAAGVLTDWIKWSWGESTPEHHDDVPGWQRYFGVSLDHKVIGIQYAVTSVILLGIAGSFAVTFRTELASPGMQFLELRPLQHLNEPARDGHDRHDFAGYRRDDQLPGAAPDRGQRYGVSAPERLRILDQCSRRTSWSSAAFSSAGSMPAGRVILR